MATESDTMLIETATRVAVLETKFEQMEEDLKKISSKLDELLELKAKGMGAVGLVSLVVGSGVLGLIMMVINFFKGPHIG
jgi:hypothetical protein